MTKLLTITAARCRIGRHRLLDIPHFSVASGEHWCLFGPNGAGKSLLAALATGQRMESGQYVAYGPGFDPAADVVRVSFEEQQRLWQRDNRLDISEFNADAKDSGTRVAELIQGREVLEPELLHELLAVLNLSDLTDQGIRFLSSGQVRRALIARALYATATGRRRLIVLDDPLESIDLSSQQSIVQCIAAKLGPHCASLQLCRREQDILPGVTHMALMDDLRVLASGPVDEIRSRAEFREITNRQPEIPGQLPNSAIHSGHASARSRSGPLIELRSVSAGYGERVVFSGLNWRMDQDDHVLIEGPNGC
ncbi:MAG: ATP-binding cassette domain-containing protein, partial [Gammaproteobacteria bacterium]